MKMKVLAMILGLATCGLVAAAQNPTASPPAPAPAPAAETPAAPAAPTAATPAEPTEPATPAEPAAAAEVVPLIVIDEVPLTDAVRNLARQSGLNFQFDPRILRTADGGPTNQPNVSIRFENVTAQEALDAVLDNYNLQLLKDPKSGSRGSRSKTRPLPSRWCPRLSS